MQCQIMNRIFNNQTTGMQAKAMQTASKGSTSNFVMYKNKRYPVSEASFFVFLHGKTYAALDELDKLKSGKIVGEVRPIKEGEKDYSDNVSGNGLQTLRIYRRFMQYYIEDAENTEYMKPICKVR